MAADIAASRVYPPRTFDEVIYDERFQLLGGMIPFYFAVVVFWFVLLGVVWAALKLAGVKPLDPKRTTLHVAHGINCLVHNLLVTGMGIPIAPFYETVFHEDSWWQPIPEVGVPCAFMWAFFVYDLIVGPKLWDAVSPSLVLHHLVGLFAMSLTVSTGFAQGWAAYYLCTEASSVCLSVRTIVSDLRGKDHWLYGVAMAGFVVLFLGVRTAFLPFYFYAWFKRPPITPRACSSSHPVILIFAWITIVPLILNSFWTLHIVKKVAQRVGKRKEV